MSILSTQRLKVIKNIMLLVLKSNKRKTIERKLQINIYRNGQSGCIRKNSYIIFQKMMKHHVF